MLLPFDDAADFFRLLESLMRFVQRESSPRGRRGPRPKPYEKQPPAKRFEIHERFAEDPARYVSAYLEANPDRLSEADLAEIAQWKDAVGGRFVFFRQLKKHLVAIETGESGRVFGILGLTQPLDEIVSQQFPALVETILMPFRGRIVCDGLISSFAIYIGPGLRRSLGETYRAAKDEGSILVSFDPPKAPAKATRAKRRAPQPAARFKGIVTRLRKRFHEIREERAKLRRFESEVVPFFETWLDTRFKKERDEVFRLAREIDELKSALASSVFGVAPEGFDSVEAAIGYVLEHTAAGADVPECPDVPEDPEGPEDGAGHFADGFPEEELEALFEEFLWEARGIPAEDLDEEDYQRAFAEFRESIEHARDGNRSAFESTLLSVGADRSKENLDAVNKAYRRLAKRLHPDKNPDHGEDVKELWEDLRKAKEALDLERIEAVEMEWRLISGDSFGSDEEARLKSFQARLRQESQRLRERREDLEDHPMWGLEARKPPKAVERQVRREIREELEYLRMTKEDLVDEPEFIRARGKSSPSFAGRNEGFPPFFNFPPKRGSRSSKGKQKDSDEQMEFPF